MHVSATEKRANEILNENNMKLSAELAVKETIIEGKQREIEKLSTHVKVTPLIDHSICFFLSLLNHRAFLTNLPPSRLVR